MAGRNRHGREATRSPRRSLRALLAPGVAIVVLLLLAGPGLGARSLAPEPSGHGGILRPAPAVSERNHATAHSLLAPPPRPSPEGRRGSAYSVTFLVDPSRCGNLTWAGNPEPNGSTVSILPGNTTLVAPIPCRGVSFVGWNVTGSVQVANVTNSSTTLITGGNGSVEAEYDASLLLIANPPGGGSIVLAGVGYGSAAAIEVPVGTYPLSEQPQLWTRFLHYYTAGMLTAGGGVLVVNGSGTLDANYTVLGAVSFSGTGGPCTNLSVNGSAVTNGTTRAYPLGTELAVAGGNCSGSRFERWSETGNVTVLGSTNGTLSVRVSGNGTMLAHYEPVYCLRIVVSPAGTASVTVNGTTVEPGACVTLAAGTYLLAYAAVAPYVFDHDAVNGSLVLASGTLALKGAGVVTLVFVVPASAHPAPVPPWWTQRGNLLIIGVLIAVAAGFFAILLFRRRRSPPSRVEITPSDGRR